MAAPQAPGRRENVLTRKLGPLPTWVWIAIIGAVVVLWAFYQRSKSKQQTSPAPGNASVTPPVIEQFQLQPAATTPPEQDRDQDDDEDPDKRHRRHRRRPHPTHHPRPVDNGPGNRGPRGKPVAQGRRSG